MQWLAEILYTKASCQIIRFSGCLSFQLFFSFFLFFSFVEISLNPISNKIDIMSHDYSNHQVNEIMSSCDQQSEELHDDCHKGKILHWSHFLSSEINEANRAKADMSAKEKVISRSIGHGNWKQARSSPDIICWEFHEENILQKSSKDIHGQQRQRKLEISFENHEAGGHHKGGCVNHQRWGNNERVSVKLILVQKLVDWKGEVLHFVLDAFGDVGRRYKIMKRIHDQESVQYNHQNNFWN